MTSKKFNFLFQGFWAVGETLGGEIVRLENQGDHPCPYYLKSIWRYADGELNSLVYDISLKVGYLFFCISFISFLNKVTRVH